MKLFRNIFEIVSVLYVTCNRRRWLHVKPNTEKISKSFQPTTKLWNYFKIISATLNTLENIH